MDPGGRGEVGEAVGGGAGEVEDLRHFAEGGTRAVGDDIAGHGCASGGVFLVDVLDDRLPTFPGRKINVDVGPGLAILREEALEEEAPTDGIAGGDFQAIADCRIGS